MNKYEIVARPKTGTKSNGYDVYHRNQTRRVWVGFATSKKEAATLRLTKRNAHPKTVAA
jgi:hypothetical protein